VSTLTTPAAQPAVAGAPCPRCQTTTVSERDAAPWCPACEWNLSAYEPRRRPPEFGWRWVDRRSHAIAYRLSSRQFTALAGRTVDRPGWGLARLSLAVAGTLFLLGIVACFAAGVYLTIAYWFGPLTIVGLLMVVFTIGLRPRLGRVDKAAIVLRREQAPALHDLIDRAASAAGSRPPRLVTVDEHFNASTDVLGLRRRRVLNIGLPLWASLPPQQRVALLGHELGHFVNGDSRRGVLTDLPLRTVGWLRQVLRPTGSWRRRHRNSRLLEMLFDAILAVLTRMLWCAQVLIYWVTMRDSQRAEYLADELAARVAGSRAAVEVCDTLVVLDGLATTVTAAIRRREGPDAWLTAADAARERLAPRLPRLRQLSQRDDASLFASHPPDGLRARMLESRPYVDPAVVLTEAESARIDAELAAWYKRTARDLAMG
jgi:heat shock protein HtpX